MRDLRSRAPKDLRPPRVREQADHAGEQAGEEHDHADAHAGALAGDGREADDGADEEDGAEEDGDEGAGALDAALGEVEELAGWGRGAFGSWLLGSSSRGGSVVFGSEEPAAVGTQEEIQPVGVDRREGHEVVLLVEEMLVAVPESGRCGGFEPSLEVPHGP